MKQTMRQINQARFNRIYGDPLSVVDKAKKENRVCAGRLVIRDERGKLVVKAKPKGKYSYPKPMGFLVK